jgi:predicted translin family RNA/ssDNA-binding protein
LGELYDAPNGLDIYIDFNTFVHALSKYQKYLNYLPFAGEDVEVDLISSILMTLNHWKNFAKKWDNVRIIGIMNAFKMTKVAESVQLKSYLIPHMHKFENERYTQFTYYMTEAIKKVQTILKYVPNMYFIASDEFDSYVIPNVLTDYEKTKRNRIVISGDSLMTGYHNMPNTKMIYAKFRRNSISQISDPMMIVQSITKVDEDIVGEFTKNKVFYDLLSIIVGDFDRGIVGMTQLGITTFAYNLLRGIEQNKIQANPKSVESTLKVIDSVYHDYILKSYPLVDIETHSKMIPQSSIQKMKSEMIDLIDIDGLRSLSIDGLNLLELL